MHVLLIEHDHRVVGERGDGTRIKRHVVLEELGDGLVVLLFQTCSLVGLINGNDAVGLSSAQVEGSPNGKLLG